KDHSPAWRGLGVAILQRVVLDRAFKSGPAKVQYVHLLREVNEAVAGKQCQLAVLVSSATMQDLEEDSSKLEKMQPKSTYIYPKLLAGLVYHSLTLVRCSSEPRAGETTTARIDIRAVRISQALAYQRRQPPPVTITAPPTGGGSA